MVLSDLCIEKEDTMTRWKAKSEKIHKETRPLEHFQKTRKITKREKIGQRIPKNLSLNIHYYPHYALH